MTRIRLLYLYLRLTFWFVPALMTLAALTLAVCLVEIDVRIDPALRRAWPEFFSVGADGSRGLLSAIASSMITIAGVTFSITIVTLSLASTQYTSRILRNFMRDRMNQAVLGVFVAIFAYCLVVLRTIRAGDQEFVPSLAVLTGIALALVGIGFLIFFIHHVADSIQASSIVQSAALETLRAVERLFPHPIGEEAAEEPLQVDVSPGHAASNWQVVKACTSGYLLTVDPEQLIRSAEKAGGIVRMESGIGEFVIEGAPLASILTNRQLEEHDFERVHDAFAFDKTRNVEQDVAFGIGQIVDVALKALSPGINDPTTASICLNHLTVILSKLAQRRMESPYRFRDGELRVIAREPTFSSLVDEAFTQVRRSAAGSVKILDQMMRAISTIATFTHSASNRQTLLHHARHIEEVIERTVACRHEQEEMLGFCRKVCESLESRAVPAPHLPGQRAGVTVADARR